MFGTNLLLRQVLALTLSFTFVPFPSPAKSKKKQMAVSQVSAGLKIYVLEGSNAVNFIPDHKGVTPVVEVRDVNELPVENAKVEFRLPDNGAGGEFEAGARVKVAVTNLTGQAEAPFTVNGEVGSFSIQVTATIDTRMGSAIIQESNSMKASQESAKTGRRWYKDWRILAAVGAGVAVTAVLLSRGGNSSTTVVLTPGAPTIGTPR